MRSCERRSVCSARVKPRHSGGGFHFGTAPWLINMQRYGPPPAYPSLPIPGLNAPIPAGAVYGYHAGGWGKPPVDEFGRPLYGDVFGAAQNAAAPQAGAGGAFAEDARWGAVEEELEEDLQEDADGRDMGGADNRSAQVEHEGDDDAGAVADGMRSALPDEDTAADGVLQLRKDAAAASGTDADGAAATAVVRGYGDT